MGKYHMTLAGRGGKSDILVTLFDFTYYTIHYTTQYTAIHCKLYGSLPVLFRPSIC